MCFSVIPQTHSAEDQAVRSVGHAGAEHDRGSEAKRHDNPGAQSSLRKRFYGGRDGIWKFLVDRQFALW